MLYTVRVQDRKGDFIWEMDYKEFDAMTTDLKELEEPSMFGNENFRIIIYREC